MDRGAGHARYRATLLSMESILDRAVCAVVAIALGAHLARGELDQFLVTTAVATCTLMTFLGLLLVFAQAAGSRGRDSERSGGRLHLILVSRSCRCPVVASVSGGHHAGGPRFQCESSRCSASGIESTTGAPVASSLARLITPVVTSTQRAPT